MTIHRLSRGPLLTAATALLLAGIVVACGPATQPEAGTIQNPPQVANPPATEHPVPANIGVNDAVPTSSSAAATDQEISTVTTQDKVQTATTPTILPAGNTDTVISGLEAGPTPQPRPVPATEPPVAEPTVAAQQEDESQDEENDTPEASPEPTSKPAVKREVCYDHGTEQKCFVAPPAMPTPRYPNLYDLSIPVQQTEDAMEEAKESGRSAETVVVPNVAVTIGMNLGVSGRSVQTWLENRNIDFQTEGSFDDRLDRALALEPGIYIMSYNAPDTTYGPDYIVAVIPADWVLTILELEGGGGCCGWAVTPLGLLAIKTRRESTR